MDDTYWLVWSNHIFKCVEGNNVPWSECFELIKKAIEVICIRCSSTADGSAQIFKIFPIKDRCAFIFTQAQNLHLFITSIL